MAASPPRIVLRHGPRCLAKRAVRACARRAALGGLALHHAQRLARPAAAHRVRAPVFLGVLDRVPAPEDPQQRLTHRGRWSRPAGRLCAWWIGRLVRLRWAWGGRKVERGFGVSVESGGEGGGLWYQLCGV